VSDREPAPSDGSDGGDGGIDYAPIDPAAAAADPATGDGAGDGRGDAPVAPETVAVPPAPSAAPPLPPLPPIPPIPPVPTASNTPFPTAGYPYAMPAARGSLPVWAFVEERPPWSTRRRVAVGIACALLAGLSVWGIVTLFQAADAALRGS
jgi:hypothetical protein